jgi:hypothetical protein
MNISIVVGRSSPVIIIAGSVDIPARNKHPPVIRNIIIAKRDIDIYTRTHGCPSIIAAS